MVQCSGPDLGPMTTESQKTWMWREWTTESLLPSAEVEALAATLWQRYSEQVEVSYPSPITGGRYVFRPKGWVGLWSLGTSGLLSIRPKVPIKNVFNMWAWAGGLQWLKGLVVSSVDEDISDCLYRMLVERIQGRLHRGLFRTYVPRSERTTRFAGRLEIPPMIQSPWRVDLPCRFQEQTADIKENKILAWTLFLLVQSRVGDVQTRRQGEKVLRALMQHAGLKPFCASDCVGFTYNRLNEDYSELHALCRFFLEFLSPGHEVGEHAMLAFQVDMAQLFERFVAAWLKAHLPGSMKLEMQWSIPYGSGDAFRADMVIQDVDTGRCLAVLDTKYKQVDAPSPADVHQVRSYAEAMDCSQAVLIYPVTPGRPLDSVLGRIRTSTLAFSLDGDLELGGESLLFDLLGKMSSSA